MKKLFLLLLSLFVSFTTLAQENPQEMSKGQIYRKKLVEQQDDLLDFLLQTPFEMRQYIFPMLNEKQSVPKKIKTHPEIIIWKGKKPTRIAKKFQNDDEFLTYLPAQFYYYLAPEMWPDEIEQSKEFEANPNRLFLNFMKNSNPDNFIPEELLNFKSALGILSQNLSDTQKNMLSQKETPVYLASFFVLPNVTLDKKLKEKGFNSTKEFAQKVDKIATIYRQYKKGKLPKESTKEAEFVKTYFSLIPMLFKNASLDILLDKKLYSD